MSPRHTTPDVRLASRRWVSPVRTLSLALLLWVAPQWAHALPATLGTATGVSCAVVREYGGDAQILDESRLDIAEVGEKTSVGCNGWVSVDQGWVTLRHRNGAVIHLGPGTFARMTDRPDAVTLFRGQAYFSPGDATELSVLTPNARARIRDGAMIVIFDAGTEKTQVVGVERRATVENRFEGAHRIAVQAGEVSDLDFQLTRVIPQVARPVAAESLKEKLALLHVDPRTAAEALRLAGLRLKNSRVRIAMGQSHGRSPAGLEFARPGEPDPAHPAGVKRTHPLPAALGASRNLPRAHAEMLALSEPPPRVAGEPKRTSRAKGRAHTVGKKSLVQAATRRRVPEKQLAEKPPAAGSDAAIARVRSEAPGPSGPAESTQTNETTLSATPEEGGQTGQRGPEHTVAEAPPEADPEAEMLARDEARRRAEKKKLIEELSTIQQE